MHIVIQVYICYKDLLEECDKEENMEVSGADITFCLKRKL
jgi:hypothetical protein